MQKLNRYRVEVEIYRIEQLWVVAEDANKAIQKAEQEAQRKAGKDAYVKARIAVRTYANV